VNARNGYRVRDRDTRVGSIDLAIPKLRQGRGYFPEWLLEPRRRAEKALVALVADALPGRGLDEAGGGAGAAAGDRADGPVPRSRSWPRAWRRWWRSSAPGPWTKGPTRTCGWTRSRSAAGRVGGL
jgi:hypothetical protein